MELPVIRAIVVGDIDVILTLARKPDMFDDVGLEHIRQTLDEYIIWVQWRTFGFIEGARIADFYAAGDDKIVYSKALPSVVLGGGL